MKKAVGIWTEVSKASPKEFESLIGIEMPYECRFACHKEDTKYVSDETGDGIKITHWMYSPDAPKN